MGDPRIFECVCRMGKGVGVDSHWGPEDDLGSHTHAHPPIHDRDHVIRPILHECVWRGWHDVVQQLLDSGVPPNEQEPWEGEPTVPLKLALDKGDVPMAKLLLDHGANESDEDRARLAITQQAFLFDAMHIREARDLDIHDYDPTGSAMDSQW